MNKGRCEIVCRAMLRLDVLAILLFTALAAGPGLAKSRPLLLPSGERVGALRGEQAPATWKALDEPGAPARFDTTLPMGGPGPDRPLIVTLGDAVAPVAPLSSKAIVVADLTLETGMGLAFVELRCAEVELRSRRRADERTAVRASVPGSDVVFEGFTWDELGHESWGTCGPRVVRQAATGPIPSHYVKAQADAATRAKLEGVVFWNQGKGCERWAFHREDDVLQLRRREVVKYPGGGLREEIQSYPFEARDDPDDGLFMYDRALTTRWLREPQAVDGNLSVPGIDGPSGAIFRIGFVRVTGSGLTWIAGPSKDVVAFHPADAETWYRSRAACEQATARR